LKEQKKQQSVSIPSKCSQVTNERTCVYIPLENISHGMAPTMPTVPSSRPHIFPTRQHGVWADANPPKPGNSRTPQPVRAQTPTAHPSTTSKRVSKFPLPQNVTVVFLCGHIPQEKDLQTPQPITPPCLWEGRRRAGRGCRSGLAYPADLMRGSFAAGPLMDNKENAAARRVSSATMKPSSLSSASSDKPSLLVNSLKPQPSTPDPKPLTLNP
jgi:hypothetical protein